MVEVSRPKGEYRYDILVGLYYKTAQTVNSQN